MIELHLEQGIIYCAGRDEARELWKDQSKRGYIWLEDEVMLCLMLGPEELDKLFKMKVADHKLIITEV